MKSKIAIGLALSLVAFGFSAVTVLADQQCATASNAAGTTVGGTSYIACGNGPVNTIMQWGDEATMPKVQAGQFVTDEYGFKIWTPDFSWGAGWVDLTHTDYYRNQMRSLVSQLQTKEQMNQFPMFQGWVGK